MNVKLFIKIEGYSEELDLYPDESIDYISKGIDYLRFDRQYAAFTKEFNIPATPKNNQLLKFWGVPGIKNSYNPHKAIEGFIVISDNLTYYGSIELKGTVLNEGSVKMYTIGFFGKTFNLKTIIADDSLNDVDFSRFDFDLNYDNMLDSWDYLLTGDGVGAVAGDIVIPIMAHEIDYCYIPEIRYHNVPCNIASDEDVVLDVDGETITYKAGVRVDHQKPGYLLKAVIETIFSNYDIEIIEWSADITATLENLYVMPSHEAGSIVADEFLQDQLCIVRNATAQEVTPTYALINFDTEDYDQANKFNLTTDTFTANSQGFHSFEIRWRNTDLLTALNEPVYILLTHSTGVPIPEKSDSPDIGSVFFTVFMQPGETITASAKKAQEGGVNYDYNFRFNNTDFPQTLYDQTITMAMVLPDIPVWDFLSGFFDAYNLLMITEPGDSEKSIRIISKPAFYDDGNLVDLTPYIEFKNQAFSKVPIDQSFTLSFTPGEDKQNEAFRKSVTRDFGQLHYYADVDFSDADFSQTNPFTIFPPAYMTNLSPDGLPQGVTNLLLHSQFNFEGEKVQSDFLLFYFNGRRPSDPYYLQDGVNVSEQTPTYTQVSTWGYYSANSLYPSATTANTTTYTPESPPTGDVATETISKNYFLDYLNLLYANGARSVKMSGYPPLSIIKNLTLADTLLINDIYYLINEYSYNWVTKQIKLDLLVLDKSFVKNFPTAYLDNGDLTFDSVPTKQDLLTYQSRETSPGVYNWSYWRHFQRSQILIPKSSTLALLGAMANSGFARATGTTFATYAVSGTPTPTALLSTLVEQKFCSVTFAPDNIFLYESGVFNIQFSFDVVLGTNNVNFFVDVAINGTTQFYSSYYAPRLRTITVGISAMIEASAGDNVTILLSCDTAANYNILNSKLQFIRL